MATTGTVKWLNDQKGFGFITEKGGDVFVHPTAIVCDGFRTLAEGDRVSSRSRRDGRGPRRRT